MSRKLVVLGMMAKIPVPGVLWQTLHYLVGFERLGFETHYIEAHARTPSMLMETAYDDGSGRAAALLDETLGRFGFGDRWTYWALHDDGRCFGRSERQLRRLLREAELIVNLHGATDPLPEFTETGRLIYLETDPVRLQIELHNGLQSSVDFLAAHAAHFTFAENLGSEVCGLPVSEQFDFKPTRQPVVLDFWDGGPKSVDELRFTTVGNWRQQWRSVDYEGERYGWSKDEEWAKVLDLPQRTGHQFELALSGTEPEDEEALRARGWAVRPALEMTLDSYRDYITGSGAELTVAKDQNVRFRSGWFSDRSATYLAAGRPVITQDTGFGEVLPTGAGLFSFRDEAEATLAVQQIAADWPKQSCAAKEIAQEHFAAERVLGRLLADVGVTAKRPRTIERGRKRHSLGPDSTVLVLIPHFKCEEWLDDCLSSLIAQTRPPDGIVVIDDASDAPPVDIVSRYPEVTLLHAAENVGPYRLIQQVIDDTDYDAFLFQDADDWSAPERLEKLLEGAAATGAELIGSQEIRIFCDEPEAVPIQWPLEGNSAFDEVPTAFTCLHPTSLVSRDLVQELGGFSSGLRFGGDAEFLRRAHWIATVANVPHYGYLRRIRQDSLTTAPSTAIGTPARKELMEETFARARANHERVAQGLEPNLSPLRTRGPVKLRHLCGPALLGMDGGEPKTRRRRRRVQPPAAQAPPNPIFVIGAERSGASALACALGQHPAIAFSQHGGHLGRLAAAVEQVRADALAEDTNVFGVDPPDAERFAAELGSALVAAAGHSSRYLVDGSWQHTRNAEELARLFPDARFIHIVRDVHSAVRALADPPLGTPGATGGTQIPARLRAKVSEAEAVERWLDAVESCLGLEAGLPPERFLTVRYDDLVADPQATVDRCLAFVGEEPAEECMRPLRAIRTLVSPERLEPDVEPTLWQRAVGLSREVCGVTKSARIVMVTDHFPKVSETFFVDKFLGLRRRGWDVHVVSQRSNKEHWEFFPTLREEIGDSDDRLHVARDDIEEKLAELEPDIVHFGYGVLAAGRMHLRDALGCHAIVSFRGFDLNSFRLDDPSVYDDVWRSADMLHIVSQDLWHQAQLRGCPPDRPHAIITDAVDVSQLQAPKRKLEDVGTAERPLRLLSVGRMHWKKGHEYALEAVQRLTEKGIIVDYRIAGDGEHRDSTEFAIRDLGIAESVQLLGALPAGDVRELYAWADVLVHPSLTEAFGVAVAEAQAMQLPVVCSDAGGLGENVVDGVTGFVVPRRDSRKLAKAIARLAQDPELRNRMGRAARKHAQANLDLDQQLGKLEALYRELLEQPAPRRRLSSHDARAKVEQETRDALRARLEQGPDPAAEQALWRREVVERVVTHVDEQLEPGSRVLVISRGDERIVDFPRHHGEHFPQADDGQYAGHHPADSADAIARLEAQFTRGAEYLVIPGTSAWWLEHYTEFASYLERRHVRVAAEDKTFVVYRLQAPAEAVA